MINSKPVGRVLPLRTQVIGVLSSLLLSTIAFAALAEDKASKESEKPAAAAPAAPDVTPVFNDVEALVKEYYPKAKIVRTGNSLHFDYKARGLAGVQSGLHELSPDSGGVAGDIVVKPGRYAGRERNPNETNFILHMVFFMAPYSEPEDHHFFTRLSYPPDAAIDFLSRFKTIIGDTKKGSQEIAVKPAAPVAPATPPPAVQTAASPPAATTTVASAAAASTPAVDAARKPGGEAAADDAISALAVAPGSKELTASKISFGSKKLSKYAYPEGRFRILLPGNPSCKYSNTLGMRSVDYSYPEPHGAYVVSYLIAPGMVVQEKIPELLDAICGSIAKTTKSVEVRRDSMALQGYQGRQIELAPPGGKDQLARFRLYVVRRFIYIIGAAGNKAWVNSPVVAEYLNSLEVTPEYTYAELRAAQSALNEKKREQDRRDSEARAAKAHMEFEEARNRNRKDFEKSQADWKYRRY